MNTSSLEWSRIWHDNMAKRSLSFLFTLEIENPQANETIEDENEQYKYSKRNTLLKFELLKIKINSWKQNNKFKNNIKIYSEVKKISVWLTVDCLSDGPWLSISHPITIWWSQALSIHRKFLQISVRNPMELEAFHYKISEIWDNLLRLSIFLEIPKFVLFHSIFHLSYHNTFICTFIISVKKL